MSLIDTFYNAQWHFGDHAIYVREVVGNAFGLASAVGGMRRRVWAWPVGIVGNVLLFTVFLGSALGSSEQGTPLYGQASRQVFFVVTSVYGWVVWRRSRARSAGAAAVEPHWASARTRVVYVVVALAAVVLCANVFHAIGAGFPAPWWYYWADSWIFVGSMLATFAMARGWVDFWLCWIAVDLVGVPELLHAQYYPSAVLYAVYAGFVVWGFVVWRRVARTAAPSLGLADPVAEAAS